MAKKYFQTEDRDIALYVSYLNRLKFHGEKAKYLSKTYVINEIIPPFFIGQSRARIIINNMLKKDLNLKQLNKEGLSKNIIETILNRHFEKKEDRPDNK